MSAVVLEHILCGVLCVCVCVCMCVLGGAVLGDVCGLLGVQGWVERMPYFPLDL